MDIEREISVRKAIKYCIEEFDVNTATNRIVEFWKDELELQSKQCDIPIVSQQRELLLDYDDWHYENKQYHSLSREQIVDKYLQPNNYR